MNELEDLLKSIRELDDQECRSPFPYADSRALHQVFQDEFDQLGPKASFNADLNLFGSTIHGWTSGGIRKDLADAGARYRAKDWLSKYFFDSSLDTDFWRVTTFRNTRHSATRWTLLSVFGACFSQR